jgi:hypothetical protein
VRHTCVQGPERCPKLCCGYFKVQRDSALNSKPHPQSFSKTNKDEEADAELPKGFHRGRWMEEGTNIRQLFIFVVTVKTGKQNSHDDLNTQSRERGAWPDFYLFLKFLNVFLLNYQL